MTFREPQTKPLIHLVVMDFDDTLYDWIGHFMPAFDAMIRTAAPLLDITEEELRKQLKTIHEFYGNTEQPFALLETMAAQQHFGTMGRDEQRCALAPAFAAFDKVRAEKLKLYSDVEPTLTRLGEEGIPVVGYSAASTVNIAKRVKMLGLAPYFTCIYASPFTGKAFPGSWLSPSEKIPVVELNRPKPDPDAVCRITDDMNVTPTTTLFVGDSVATDIAPAIAGGAQAALIQRDGTSTAIWLPDLLKISHRAAETRADSASLTDDDLARVPVLKSLVELWQHFHFVSNRVSTQETT